MLHLFGCEVEIVIFGNIKFRTSWQSWALDVCMLCPLGRGTENIMAKSQNKHSYGS